VPWLGRAEITAADVRERFDRFVAAALQDAI
jgi:hypothetical protein